MLRLPFLRVVLLAAFAVTVAGCQTTGRKDSGQYGQEGDTVNGSALPDRQEGVSFLSSNVDRNKFSPVYFDFDSYAIRPEDRGKIHEVAEFLRSNHTSIIIAGFTDERGTPEYNRGLGERRALAVRQAVIAEGGDGSKLQTVSFGAEMPADPASNESAWAKNRRAEFGVVR